MQPNKIIFFYFSFLRELNYFTVTPGPAIYPRDAEHEGIINSIHPRDLANKFSMVPRRYK